MIHYVTPQRSDDPATAPVADPSPPSLHDAGDAPPGPLSVELDYRGGGAPASEAPPESPPGPRRPTSWDAVPHPVGPIPEPPATERPVSGRSAPRAATAPEAARSTRPLAAAAVHSLGPVGRRRSSVVAFLLAVVTLGLHPIAWVQRANAEMAHFDPRMVVRPGRTAGALAFIVGLPIFVAAAEGARIIADHAGAAPNLPLSAQATRWLLLAPAVTPLLAVLVPFSLVALTLTLERVRVVEDRAGVDPDLQLSPSGVVWWTALPVIGLAVVVARGQARLNGVWDACAGPARR
jgi:hypothetical protein